MASEIQAGKFASNQILPAPKDYAVRLGLHPATVRKAFALLEARGLIRRQGRSWSVSRPRSRGVGKDPVVLCIGAPGQDGKLRMDTDPEWDFWREIQAEVLRNGLEPRVETWVGRLPDGIQDAFGAIVSNWHMLDSSPLLDALLRRRLPTALWVANFETLPDARYRQVRGLWFHDLATGRDAGKTMARFVAESGHRRIAWVSPFQASPWAKNRLAGLREGLGESVEIVEACGAWTSEWEIQTDVMKDPAVLGRFSSLEGIDLEAELPALARPLVEAVTRQRYLQAFGPKLEHALESGATLWVVCSDIAANWCLHWLRSRGLGAPGDLAVASFDDTREATHLDLTSLRFDVQEMARSMVHQILSARQRHSLVTRYAGRIMARGTTAAIPSPRSGP
jgi:DNA-binding LacI/PurR family transcriptional regulator